MVWIVQYDAPETGMKSRGCAGYSMFHSSSSVPVCICRSFPDRETTAVVAIGWHRRIYYEEQV